MKKDNKQTNKKNSRESIGNLFIIIKKDVEGTCNIKIYFHKLKTKIKLPDIDIFSL